jgi:hypothetical protein
MSCAILYSEHPLSDGPPRILYVSIDHNICHRKLKSTSGEIKKASRFNKTSVKNRPLARPTDNDQGQVYRTILGVLGGRCAAKVVKTNIEPLVDLSVEPVVFVAYLRAGIENKNLIRSRPWIRPFALECFKLTQCD